MKQTNRMVRHTALAIFIALATAPYVAAAQATQVARGVVFEDRNGNGVRDANEPGIRGVRVSNQRQVVLTDSRGRYELPVTDDTILFVIKPRGWAAPVDENGLARFYYIHKPAGSPKLQYEGVLPSGPLPESVDFPLHRQKEPNRFRVLVFGDTQPRDQTEIDYIAHDVVEGLVGFDAAFGITLGDIVFNDLSLMESMKRTIGQIGLPWVYIGGNHDMNHDAPSDMLSDETFERHFGPPYYSFDYGPVHFVVLEDIHWRPKTEAAAAGYSAGLGEKQLEFLRNDLSLVPRATLVVLMMHIPLEAVAERQEVYRLLASRPHTFSMSAHTHTQEHRFIGKEAGWQGSQPHHHFISGTVCGSWWSGAPDELGIPHATMSDGTPNGYSILTFDGTKYALEFRAARRPADYQMNICAPEEVAAGDAASTDVLVNVFAGSSRSKVEMRVGQNGPWVAMDQVRVQDPAYVTLKEQEKGPKPPPGRTLPGASVSSHVWRGKLPPGLTPGTHAISVRTTDMFGKTYEARRVIRVR